MNPQQLQALPQKHKALILYFFHDQCAPCLSLRPKVSDLVKGHFPEIELVFIDAFKHPELSAAMGAFAFPTLILYLEGTEAGRWSKYVSISQLQEHISRPYDILFG